MIELCRHLAGLIVEDNAILLVGTDLRRGSDESPLVQQLADALAARIDYQRAERHLPAVARDFQTLKGRHALIEVLQEELERLGTEPAPVHQLLLDAVVPGTKVITSRFDHLLENALEQAHRPYVLIVRDTDLPFFDEKKITLIKIQGDINQPDSLVVTEDDVNDFIHKLPTISDIVRAYVATKTLIFLGYDLSSPQFKQFFRQVSHDLKGYRRQAYAITGEPVDPVERQYWEQQGVELHACPPLDFLKAMAQQVRLRAAAAEPAGPRPASLAQAPLPARPYKALDSFTAADAAIFSGRREESQRLANRILANQVTVLCGEMGSGKTSLLQAGAGPLLAQQRALLAIASPAAGRPLAGLLPASLLAAGEQAGLAPPADPGDLAALIRTWQQVQDGPLVLAVDQFEQFFLVYSPAEQAAAVATLHALCQDETLFMRLVLVVREDFLGRLQTLEPGLPGLMAARFWLERLGLEAARAAIVDPVQPFGLRWDPQLVQRILDELSTSGDGGVYPPQLQIVCDRLFDAATAHAPANGATAGPEIDLALFTALGGTEGILGDYLDSAVHRLPPAQQPLARGLLGALVNSQKAKQRLPLDDLARIVAAAPADAATVLDELARQRLVRRYEMPNGGSGPVAYELTHDYLAARIARWLGPEFWDQQKARELVRQALPLWRTDASLPAPDVVRLATTQHGRVRFAPAESQMLYAAAVSYGLDAAAWEADLTAGQRRDLLLHLLQEPEATTRARAAKALVPIGDQAAAPALAQAMLADPDPAVRAAVATAAASGITAATDGTATAVVNSLAQSAVEPATEDAAMQALATIRDQEPAVDALIPPEIAGPVHRRVAALRLSRSRQRILADIGLAMQWGFLGFGLSLGLLTGLFALGQDLGANATLAARLATFLFSVSAVGTLGALAAGVGAAVRGVMLALSDQGPIPRVWLAGGITSGIVLGILLPALLLNLPGGRPAGLSQLLTMILAGLLLGVAAAVPLRLAWPLRIVVAAFLGGAIFGLAGLLLGVGSGTPAVLGRWIIAGIGAGIGMFAGLNPGFWKPGSPPQAQPLEGG